MVTMIETLESRQMFSAALHSVPQHVGKAHDTHVSAPAKLVQPLFFKGSALNADGQLDVSLQMTIRATDSGYRDEVVVTNSSGNVSQLVLMLDASGHFTFDKNETGKQLHIEGQLSADKKNITGTFSQMEPGGSSQGTLSLSRVSSLQGNGGTSNGKQNPQPKPTTKGDGTHKTDNHGGNVQPAPQPKGDAQGTVTGTFKGSAIDSKGETTNVVIAVSKAGGSFSGHLQVVNSDGSGGVVPLTFNASGHFTYDGPGGKETLHVEGQLSADLKSIAGTWTSVHADGTMGSGTFSATRT